MKQFDYIQAEAAKYRRLLKLREVIATEMVRQMPFSETSINITLMMIRQIHGQDAEIETRYLFGLTEQSAA